MAARAREHVTEYARIQPAVPPPPLEAVGRKEWARANLETMGGTLEPLLERLGSGPAAVGRRRAHRRRGGRDRRLHGAQRARPVRARAARSRAPAAAAAGRANLREAARAFEADEGELLEWVVFHEITHAVQFTGVPWLREYLASLLRELLSSVKVEVDPTALLRLPKMQDLRAAWDSVRQDGLVHAVAGPERKEIIDRLQAVMALIEGHAEHVMDAAGAEVLPRCPSCASRSSAGGGTSRRWSSCSSACSASTSRCASTSSASASATPSCATGGSRASTAPGALRRTCRRSPSSTTRPPGSAERMFVL